MIGYRFGRLLVLEKDDTRSGRHDYFMCVCDCGNKISTRKSNLISGCTKSCGCLRRQLAKTNMPQKYRRKGVITFRKALYSRYKQDSVKRKISFSLSFDWFCDTIEKPCYYCGISNENVWKNQSTLETFSYSGIDRINSDIGYCDDNVVPCCSKCNYAKRCMTKLEFITWVCRVYDHFHKLKEE